MTMSRTDKGVLWQEELKRMGVDNLLGLLTEIRDSQQGMEKRMNDIEAGIGSAIQKHIGVAFAGGDPDGHRRAHEAMIRLIEEKRRLRVAIQEKTLSGLAWAAIVFLALAAWSKIKGELGYPP